MTKLGVADSAAVLLVNPRPLDAELSAKVKNAKPEERVFLARFADVWKATEAAAIYLTAPIPAWNSACHCNSSPRSFPPVQKPGSPANAPSELWSVIPDQRYLRLLQPPKGKRAD